MRVSRLLRNGTELIRGSFCMCSGISWGISDLLWNVLSMFRIHSRDILCHSHKHLQVVLERNESVIRGVHWASSKGPSGLCIVCEQERTTVSANSLTVDRYFRGRIGRSSELLATVDTCAMNGTYHSVKNRSWPGISRDQNNGICWQSDEINSGKHWHPVHVRAGARWSIFFFLEWSHSSTFRVYVFSFVLFQRELCVLWISWNEISFEFFFTRIMSNPLFRIVEFFFQVAETGSKIQPLLVNFERCSIPLKEKFREC